MRRFVVLTVVLTLALSVLLCAEETTRVVDSTRAVSILVPAGWTVQQQPTPGSTLTVIDLRQPGLKTNMNLMIEYIGSATLADYMKVSLKNGPKILPRYKLVSSKKTKAAGVPAYEIVYTASLFNPPVPMKFKAVVVARKGCAYTLTFTASPARYKKEVAAFASTVKSWKWE